MSDTQTPGTPGRARRVPKPPGKAPVKIDLPDQDQNAYRLLTDIKEHRVDPKTCTPAQRRALLVVLAHGKQTSSELGAFFGVSAKRIRADVAVIRKEVGHEIRDWTVEEVLGQLAQYAERCTSVAMKNDDVGLAWQIQRDLVKTLKEFGLLGGHEQEGGIKITIESLSANTINAKRALLAALDPRLTGEVVDTTAIVKGTTDPTPLLPALPLGTRRANEDPTDPRVEINQLGRVPDALDDDELVDPDNLPD